MGYLKDSLKGSLKGHLKESLWGSSKGYLKKCKKEAS